jgi:hypothetical protein
MKLMLSISRFRPIDALCRLLAVAKAACMRTAYSAALAEGPGRTGRLLAQAQTCADAFGIFSPDSVPGWGRSGNISNAVIIG